MQGPFCPGGIGAWHAGPNNIQKYVKKKKTVYYFKINFSRQNRKQKYLPLEKNSDFFKFSEALCT